MESSLSFDQIPFESNQTNCKIFPSNSNTSSSGETELIPGSIFQCDQQNVFDLDPSSLSSQTPKGKMAVYQGLMFVAVTLSSMLINLRVICIVVTVPRKRLRHASILAAHFSLVIIFSAFVGILYLAEKANVLKIPGPQACIFVSYLSNTFHSVFSLNIIGINYERIRTFKITLAKLLVYRTICYVWIAALLGNIPAIFMVEYVVDPQTNLGKCKQVHLFGSFYATLVYEIIRFMVYYGFVVGYMIYALYRIRSKIKYLYILKPIPNEKMRRKVHKVRFVYFHSVIFIVVWLPIGLLSLFYKVSSRQNMFSSTPMIYFSLVVINWIFVTFNPLIHLHMSEDMSHMKWWWFTYQRQRVKKESGKRSSKKCHLNNHGNESQINSTEHNDEGPESTELQTTNGCHLSEISRFSTIGKSSSENSSVEGTSRSSTPSLSPSPSPVKSGEDNCMNVGGHTILFIEKTCETFI
ncbi:unnamed protein product [Orchesella dallaii]|uniref:G-protein coupled receptors family 1 profile domain-containing protein n=1 Tax=Orchesella dallaii TaxID=48710 RepID=A0ABP1RWE9_9HEXA